MSRAHRAVFLSAVVGSLLVTIPRSPAQSIFGTIVGTVTDPSSAVVSGAHVIVVNAHTNEKRQFVTDEKGNCEIDNLFPGVYALEVEMAGFAKYRQEQLEAVAGPDPGAVAGAEPARRRRRALGFSNRSNETSGSIPGSVGSPKAKNTCTFSP